MREIELAFESEGSRAHLFRSYPEFVGAALGPSEMPDSNRSSRSTDTPAWYGGFWEMARQTAITGDLRGAGALRSSIIREANQIMGRVERMDPVYREEGGIWIDVSRYLSGEPEVWGDMVYQGEKRTARQVSIVFNAVGNCNVQAKDYERAARLIGSAIVGLKASGISVSLLVTYTNRQGRHSDITAIDMTPGGAFDMARLSAICRTWFFRRIVFSYWETREKEFRATYCIYRNGGYGRSEKIPLEAARLISGVHNPLILEMEQMTDWTDDKIRDTILDVLKRKEAVS